MRQHHFLSALLPAILLLSPGTPAHAAPGDPVFETCPSAEDTGDNVECYPVTFTSRTEIHPDGIPVIGYLFVPKNRPAEPLPAIVFAHGSGSMYSSGNHNKGLNSKQIQWVRQYTSDRGIISLHVSSFHSRYLLPDTPGDQRILDWEHPPEGVVGGDDYRATSTIGGQDDASDDYVHIPFDPEQDGFNDHNGRAGISETIERAYDMDAAWDFLAGIRKGRFIANSRDEDSGSPTLRQPMAGIGYIGEIVQNGLVIDHERIFLYGTSHGGQTAMATAHAPRALGDGNPMNADLPAGFNRHRYAAFFDYYGGCGLYGAYNGANFDVTDPEGSSTWRPYNAFLMLHGENDPIWQKADAGTTREKWFAGECWPRIAAAKADPAFDTFLEAIIYAGAHHSFDGVARNDFTNQTETAGEEDYDEWIAKIHANERMTLGMISGIGDIVSARRNNAATVPELADFGFNEHNPYFSTIPLAPALPPRVDYAESLSTTDGIVVRSNGSLYGTGVHGYITAVDPASVYAVSCAMHNGPVEIDIFERSVPGGRRCEIVYNLTATQLDTLPLYFSVKATTPLGATLVPVVLEDVGTNGVSERYLQAYSIPPAGYAVSTDIDENNEIAIDTRAIAWSWQPALDQRFATVIEPSPAGMNGGLTMENEIILGPAPPTADQASFIALSGHSEIHKRGLGLTFVTVANHAEITVDDFGARIFGADQKPLPPNDFISQYNPLPVIDDSTPLPPGEFPEGTAPGPGNPGPASPGPNNPGPDIPGDGGTGTGNGDPRGTFVPPAERGLNGGGALFWLLPFVLLFRRRR